MRESLLVGQWPITPDGSPPAHTASLLSISVNPLAVPNCHREYYTDSNNNLKRKITSRAREKVRSTVGINISMSVNVPPRRYFC